MNFSVSFRKNCKLIFLVLIFSVISGCAAVPEIPPEKQITTRGLLIGTMYLKDVAGIGLESSDGKSIFIGTHQKELNSRYIAEWVDPGEYKVVNIQQFGISNKNIIAVPEGSFPKIEVKLGEVVDLNNLIGFSLGEGQYTIISAKRTHPFVPPLLQNNPELFDGINVVPWTASGPISQSEIKFGSTGSGLIIDLLVENELMSALGNASTLSLKNITHKKAIELIKPLSTPTTRISSAPDGTPYFGTALGQIRYKKGEQWSYLDTGYIDSITAIYVVSSNNITVGLASGLILETTDGGKSWRKIYKYNNDSFIVDLHVIEGELFISTIDILEGNSNVDYPPIRSFTPIISMSTLHDGKLNKFHTENLPTSNSLMLKLSPPLFEYINDYLFVMWPAKKAFRVNIKTKEVSQISVPEIFTDASVNKEKGYLTVWSAGGIFSDALYSKDFGDTWFNLPKPGFRTNHIELKSPKEAYMLSERGYSEVNIESDKWVDKFDDLNECNQVDNYVLVNMPQKEYYCVMSNGSLKTFRPFKDNHWN